MLVDIEHILVHGFEQDGDAVDLNTYSRVSPHLYVEFLLSTVCN